MDMEERSGMTKLSLLLTTVTSSILLAGCGSDNKDSSPIEGTWQDKQSCERTGNTSEKILLEFNSGNVAITNTSYTDSNCTVLDEIVRVSGNYFIHNEITLSNGEKAQQIEIRLSKKEVTPPSESEATNANAVKLCGYTDWKKHELKDVTTCAAFDFLPQQSKDIFKVEGNSLFLGDDDQEKGADGYPLVLEQNSTLVRK